MRFLACAAVLLHSIVVVGAASSATSSSSTAVPACGLQCIQSVALDSICGFNITCICANNDVQNEIKTCVASNCTIREALESEKYAYDTCGVVGEDRTGLIWSISVAFFAVAVVAFGLRCLERIRSRMWGADDWALTLVTIMMVPITTFMILLSQAGLGLDAWNISGDDIERVLFLFFFEEVFYPCALALIKISILLFYLRVFPKRMIRILVYILILLNIGYAAAFSIALIFQCNPIRGAWEAWDGQHPATCLDTNSMGFAAAGVNIVLDVATLTLPLHDVTKLRMGLRKKIQVLAMFAVGFFVTLISILRLKSLIEFGSTKNPTQDYVEAAYWSMIELCVGILCASMPAIRALLVQALPAVFGSQIYGSGIASHPTKSDRYGISRGDKAKPLSSTDASSKNIMIKNQWVVVGDRNSNGSDVELVALESKVLSKSAVSDLMADPQSMQETERWRDKSTGSRNLSSKWSM